MEVKKRGNKLDQSKGRKEDDREVKEGKQIDCVDNL